jgi:hypothetical protein
MLEATGFASAKAMPIAIPKDNVVIKRNAKYLACFD